MKSFGLVVMSSILMLSACENKNEQKSIANSMPPPSEQVAPIAIAQPSPPIVAEQPKPAVMTNKASKKVERVAATEAETLAKSEKSLKVQVPERTILASTVTEPMTSIKVDAPPTTSDVVKIEAPNHEDGLALAGKSGCLACHKIDSKLVGPAWRDVSKRYQGDSGANARLIAKVKAGGKGNWTDVTGGMAMPPYSPRVSNEDIEKLVAFVLSQ